MSGLRFAVTSSRRPTGVVCGASRTICGSLSISSAISIMASTKRSSVANDSVSVGSIIRQCWMGQLMVASIFTRDYLLVQGITLVFALGIICTNFIVDVVNVALDPRIDP